MGWYLVNMSPDSLFLGGYTEGFQMEEEVVSLKRGDGTESDCLSMLWSPSHQKEWAPVGVVTFTPDVCPL